MFRLLIERDYDVRLRHRLGYSLALEQSRLPLLPAADWELVCGEQSGFPAAQLIPRRGCVLAAFAIRRSSGRGRARKLRRVVFIDEIRSVELLDEAFAHLRRGIRFLISYEARGAETGWHYPSVRRARAKYLSP